MTIEKQLERLAELGLSLDEGVTVDDLLYSFDRSAYESRPFDLILFILGAEVEREPWGRSFCSRVWNFDTECIYSTGDYVEIVNRLSTVAGQPERLKSVRDKVDLASGEAWLEYEVDGKHRHWAVEVNDDWADTMTISYVIADLEQDGKRFYFKDNGQAMVLFYLDVATAAALNELSHDALKPMLG